MQPTTDANACKLGPGEGGCNFKAKPGDKVTIEVKDVVGNVLISRAEYPVGTPLSGTPGKRVSFTVVAGNNGLKLLFAFTEAVTGKGELREVCTDNTLLAFVNASDPMKEFAVCA